MSFQECAGGFYGFFVGLQECCAIGASLHMSFKGCGKPSAKAGGEIIADQDDFFLAARDLRRSFFEGFLTHSESVPYPRRIFGVL